jgi:bacterioferritin-associated ferredoxin
VLPGSERTFADMYVCICNALTTRRIHGAIREGAASVEAVYRSCGVAPRCGKCGPTIHSILSGERRAEDRRIGEGWGSAFEASAA